MSLLNSSLGNVAIRKRLSSGKSVYFVGIGGIGMQALAILLKKRGYTVRGSDRAPNAAAKERLAEAGIPLDIGHCAENVGDAALLVYTLALAEDTPELLAAAERGIPSVSRAELLGYLASTYAQSIAVAGTHGKSSVTALLSHLLVQCGADPTVISGAPLGHGLGPLRLGGEALLLMEACEYKDSFLSLSPRMAVVLNAEWEHADYFPERDAALTSFRRFLSRAPMRIVPAAQRTLFSDACERNGKLHTFGREGDANSRATAVEWQSGCAAFTYCLNGREIGRTALSVPGVHNLDNALAALAAFSMTGADPLTALAALPTFCGIPRRLERKGRWHGMTVYDDYAHHPTEIAASLAALRTGSTGGRLICVFQAHTYSRTAAFFEGFATALTGADRVILLDIYAAREKNESGVSARALAAAIPSALYAEDKPTALSLAAEVGRTGDLLVFMGAGDIADLPASLTYDPEF